MKVKFSFESNRNIILPVGFKEILQWFIYSSIKDEWLHSVGFSKGKRSFKLFCFSEILQKARFIKEKDIFIFPRTISFIVSSPVDWILEKLATGSLINHRINLGGNSVNLKEIAVLKQAEINENEITVKTLSPIEVHSTFEINGRRKTHYYTPFEDDFSRLINDNAKRKWEAFYKEKCPFDLKIKPIGFNKERIVKFGQKNRYVLVKGWSGNFKLYGEPEFLRFIVDAGLGSRNSQGFGMVEVIGGK